MQPPVELPRSRIDPSKVTTMFALLAVFLLVLEGLLLAWMLRAEGATERTVVGAFMSGLLLAFLAIVLVMVRRGLVAAVPLTAVPAPTLPSGEVAPATSVATRTEVERVQPDADVLAGPSGDYLIDRPPRDWTVRRLTVAELVAEELAILEDDTTTVLPASVVSTEAPVLTMTSPRSAEVVIDPSTTLVEDSPVFSAIPIVARIRLTISALPRVFPPRFMIWPLEQRFLLQLYSLLQVGTLVQSSSGTVGGTRRFYAAELRQRVANADVQGQPSSGVELTFTAMAIEGDVADHFLLMQHFTPIGVAGNDFREDLETLERLANSFRPLSTLRDKHGQELSLRERDKALEAWREEYGETVFLREFRLLLLRIKRLDLSQESQLNQALRLISPLRGLAESLKVDDEDLVELWDAIQGARRGTSAEFREELEEWIGILATEDEADQPDGDVPAVLGDSVVTTSDEDL